VKIRLLAGFTNGMKPGDEWELSEDEAQRLIAAGFAQLATEPRAEKAVKPAPRERRAK